MGTRNKLVDLNDHLFAELERLGDEELTDEKLEQEIQKAKAITGVAHAVINNANLIFQAKKHHDEYNGGKGDLPGLLQIANNGEK